MQSSSQGRYGYPGYQGYPYVNPIVHDVPSIDPQTASRWANLPRRPLNDGPSVVAVSPGSSGGGSSQTTQSANQDRQNRYQGYPYVNPVYNDVSTPISPGSSVGSSSRGNTAQASQRPQTPSSTPTPRNDTVPPKKDIDENPVVYIDLPEAGSEVSRSIEIAEDEEPEFVQDTIMYDPFENRRIDMRKDDERSPVSSETGSTTPYTPQYQNSRSIVMRPDALNLAGGSGSNNHGQSSSSRQTSGLPSFMSKESEVYGGTDGADGFPLSPIPISQFPEPPPAYSEVAQTPAPREPVVNPPVVEAPQPPRTQVIVNEQGNVISSVTITRPMNPVVVGGPFGSMTIIGREHINQKYLICHNCGARVHTIVKTKTGGLTHFVACLAFLIFLPFLLIVYFTDYFKYKNHYCPSCFKLIGYETPVIGKKVNYVT